MSAREEGVWWSATVHASCSSPTPPLSPFPESKRRKYKNLQFKTCHVIKTIRSYWMKSPGFPSHRPRQPEFFRPGHICPRQDGVGCASTARETWRQAHALSQPANDLTAPRAAILAATFGPGKVCVLFFIFKNMEQITWSQHQSLSDALLTLNSPTSSEIFGFRAIFCNGFICKDLSIYVTIIIACRDDKRSLSWFPHLT